MVTTSEVAVSITIDDTTSLKEITNELESIGSVEVDTDQSIICLAGDFSHQQTGASTAIFNSLTDIPIRMISYGGSNYNVSLVVNTGHKIDALRALNKGLFETAAV